MIIQSIKQTLLRETTVLCLMLCMGVGAPSLLHAEQTELPPLTGHVVKAGAPISGAQVTLHRVTPSVSGPLASEKTDAAGEFHFQLPAVDTAAFTVFFVTVDYQTVRYFGAPIHKGQTAPYSVEVFDTTSVLPPHSIRAARRDIVLVPTTDGGWEVNEIVRIRNTADKALVLGGALPSWELRIPSGAADFQAGEGELAPEDVRLMDDRVFLLTSLVPGDREVFLRYRLPPELGTTALTLDLPTDTLNLYVRQPAPTTGITGLVTTRALQVDGENFIQYGAMNLAAGSNISMEWSASTGLPFGPITAGVVAAAILLALGTWAAYRNRDPRALPSGVPTANGSA